MNIFVSDYTTAELLENTRTHKKNIEAIYNSAPWRSGGWSDWKEAYESLLELFCWLVWVLVIKDALTLLKFT